jgi:hypothetical protein
LYLAEPAALKATVKAGKSTASKVNSKVKPLKTNIILNSFLTSNMDVAHDILLFTIVLLRDTVRHFPLIALLDSSSTFTRIARQAIPASIMLTKQAAIHGNTLSGSFLMAEYIPA